MRKDRIFSVAAAILLALMAVMAGGAALRQSVTFDEVSHIGAGVSYWQQRDLRLNPEHPPLAKALAAAPLVLRGTRADYSSPQWTVSVEPIPAFVGQWVFGEWLLFRWNDPVSTLAWARLPMLLLTLALGWVIYRMGRRLGGPWGGLLSVALYASTPLFITFGPLVHNDIAITLFSLLSIWSFADLYRDPARRRVWVFAACLVGALLSKFSAVALFAVFLIVVVGSRWLPMEGQPADRVEQKAWRRLRWRAAFRGVLLAGGMVYAVYALLSWNQPVWGLDYIPGGPALEPLRRILAPAWGFLFGLVMMVAFLSPGRPTFLLGQAYSHGVWYFYPVLLVLKSTLGFLAALALGAAVGLGARRRWVIPAEAAIHWRAIWVSLIVLAGVCMTAGISISIRHFSMPLALMILMLAPLPAALARLRTARPRLGRALQGLTAAAAASSVLAAALAYPYYFPYMNLLDGGRPAYTLASDSNVDWNQSLPEVRRFAEARGLKELAVDPYAITDPAQTVPGARVWDCQKPTERERGQWVVVSANMILDGHNCRWLERFPREELAGGSMYAFRLPEDIPPAGKPGGPPLPSEYRQFGGMPAEYDIRTMTIQLANDPSQMQPMMARMKAQFAREMEKARKRR